MLLLLSHTGTSSPFQKKKKKSAFFCYACLSSSYNFRLAVLPPPTPPAPPPPPPPPLLLLLCCCRFCCAAAAAAATVLLLSCCCFSAFFCYAYPSSSFRCAKYAAFFVTAAAATAFSLSSRCSRKRPSLLSLACASGRLSFAVGERYYCVYFLSAISFHVRTYADASFHVTIQARSTNTRFTYCLLYTSPSPRD